MVSIRRPILRSLLAVLGLVAALGVAPGAAGAEDTVFVSGFDDIPLMPGLVEDPEQSLNFDTPGGRVVEAVASGAVSADDAMAFYAATLPELGWKQTGEGLYAREDETLSLEISAEGDEITVRFASSPREDTGSTP